MKGVVGPTQTPQNKAQAMTRVCPGDQPPGTPCLLPRPTSVPPSFRVPRGIPVTAHSTFPPLTSKALSGLALPAGMCWGPCLPLMLSSSSSSSSVPLAPAAKNINQRLDSSRASLSEQKTETYLLVPLLVALLLPRQDKKKSGRAEKFKTGRKTLLFSPAQCPAENKQPSWGHRDSQPPGLAGAVSWMPESKHGEEKAPSDPPAAVPSGSSQRTEIKLIYISPKPEPGSK